MKSAKKLSYLTLTLLISFASVNAVLFTPGLPTISTYFAITDDTAQLTITWFLIGYSIGQLLYGPIANRFGRKPALYMGVILQILSSLLCVSAGYLHVFSVLVTGRFLLALGAGVGLKMTFTLVNESYEPKLASKIIAYLMLAFAITPGTGVAIGGILNQHYGWMSCFYAGAVYGCILLWLVTRLPETHTILHYDAFKMKNLIAGYSTPFKSGKLLACSLLMGGASSFVYVFATLAPFVAINLMGMNSSQYGLANILPPIGLMAGSLTSARLTRQYALSSIIRTGILVASAGALLMITTVFMQFGAMYCLFLPLMVIYFGLSLILPNASVIAMNQVSDKAHGSSVMSFINMGSATVVVLGLGFLPIHALVLPGVYVLLCLVMGGLYFWLMLDN